MDGPGRRAAWLRHGGRAWACDDGTWCSRPRSRPSRRAGDGQTARLVHRDSAALVELVGHAASGIVRWSGARRARRRFAAPTRQASAEQRHGRHGPTSGPKTSVARPPLIRVLAFGWLITGKYVTITRYNSISIATSPTVTPISQSDGTRLARKRRVIANEEHIDAVQDHPQDDQSDAPANSHAANAEPAGEHKSTGRHGHAQDHLDQPHPPFQLPPAADSGTSRGIMSPILTARYSRRGKRHEPRKVRQHVHLRLLLQRPRAEERLRR